MAVINTNPVPDGLLTTKGDLVVASDPSVPARLAVGTDGQVLTADSTVRNGVKWATAAGGLSTSTDAAVAEGVNKTATHGATTHVTFDAQLTTGTDLTAPDNKTFQVNSDGTYYIYAYCILTPATADAGMRQLRSVGSGSVNAASPNSGGNTATWTPDGVSNGTSKRVKLTIAYTSFLQAGDQIQLDFENRDAANDTPLYYTLLVVRKMG